MNLFKRTQAQFVKRARAQNVHTNQMKWTQVNVKRAWIRAPAPSVWPVLLSLLFVYVCVCDLDQFVNPFLVDTVIWDG